MNAFQINIVSEAIMVDASFDVSARISDPLSDVELNTLGDSLVSILNAKHAVPDFEVVGITRADTVSVAIA